MKKKLKKLKRLSIYSLTLFCLIGCEKDVPPFQSFEQEISQETKLNRINLSQFEQNISDPKKLENLKQFFDLNTTKTTDSNKLSASSQIIILTDEIIEIRKKNLRFYTFKVLTYAVGNRFYNLVITVNQQQKIVKSEFLEYNPSEEWLADSSLPFTGLVRLVNNDFLDVNDFFTSKSSNLCVTDANGAWECDAGNAHSSADCKTEDNPDGVCTACGAEYFITVEYGACPETIDAGDSNGGYPVSNDPSYGGGDGSSGGTSTVPSEPCDTQTTGLSGGDGCHTSMEDIEKDNLVQSLGSKLSSQQISWIDNSSSIDDIMAINDYLDESNYFNASLYETFAIEAINALMNLGDIDMHNRLVYNPLIAQDYRAKMSDTERQLFDQLNLFQKEGYLRAATQAYIYSESHFPQPVRNRLGDAFKHTFWNALSTIYITASITEQLTTAHEDIPYNYTNHFKETQMDLHNNAQGRQIAYGAGRIVDMVEQAMNNGDLRYLNHLELSGSFWRATDNSILIPTNE